MTALVAALLLALAQSTTEGSPDRPQQGTLPTPKDRGSTAESSQRGSAGSTAGGAERTGAPGAGIESGQANGLAGGRTDEGPRGGTGIRNSVPPGEERARAKADDQDRGPNPPGSFERPADTPPDINREPAQKSVERGSAPPAPKARGRNYGRRKPERLHTPGGAATQGSAGHGEQTGGTQGAGPQPD